VALSLEISPPDTPINLAFSLPTAILFGHLIDCSGLSIYERRSMQTYSHFLATAALRRAIPRLRQIPRRAVYLGSIAPDLPLLLLSIGSFFYYRTMLGWDGRLTFRYIYDILFFTDPFWIVSHNTLHAPVVLLAGLGMLWKIHGREKIYELGWFWFLASCLFHAFIDVFTHYDDGPLLFFPFDWQYRFFSPVSYWDRDHYGAIFSRFERILDVLLVLYLSIPLIVQRLRKKALAERVYGK
jgi:hypothetical protein